MNWGFILLNVVLTALLFYCLFRALREQREQAWRDTVAKFKITPEQLLAGMAENFVARYGEDNRRWFVAGWLDELADELGVNRPLDVLGEAADHAYLTGRDCARYIVKLGERTARVEGL